jgi:glucosamine--fructose-6-phosphate aminotransferase (isomerizing)
VESSGTWARASCVELLVDGLRRLEYRGYDSAGLAIHDGKEIRVVRSVGKLGNLVTALKDRPLAGAPGIGHTRWATHGRPSELERAPARRGRRRRRAQRHHREPPATLKRELVEARASRFASDTDTEIVAHLVERERKAGHSLEEAVREALTWCTARTRSRCSADEPHRIVVAKNSSPLVIGLGEGETFCASDIPAILPYTRDMLLLEDGEMAVLEASGAVAHHAARRARSRARCAPSPGTPRRPRRAASSTSCSRRSTSSRAPSRTRCAAASTTSAGTSSPARSASTPRPRRSSGACIVACGTSNHAALYGRYLVEALARLPSTAELASEFVTRDPVVGPNDLVVAVSQSGETIDTLAAVKAAKERGARVLALANVLDSAIPRASHGSLYTHAGPEIGVASTKCFTTQLARWCCSRCTSGASAARLDTDRAREVLQGLVEVPHRMRDVLALDDTLRDLARQLPGREELPLPRPRRELPHRGSRARSS